MPFEEAEERLGLRIKNIKGVAPEIIMANAQYSVAADARKETKERVYRHIVEYLQIGGYPTFEENDVHDLVLYIIGPVLFDFISMTGRDSIQLSREKEIISVDAQTGGNEEFVVVDEISVREEQVVFIVEAKRTCVGQAMKQILLSLKDARDNIGGGVVYGFVTTGQIWQMLSYDGASFQMASEIMAVFNGMDGNKEGWMKNCSIIVDCLFFALENGGMKNVVVGAGKK